MSIEFRIRDESAILNVKAAGTCDSLVQLKEYVLAMHRAAQSAGVTRVLVDERELCYHLSTVDSFESGKFVAEKARSGVRIAVACSSEAKASARFWETVAINRGAPLKVFDDIDDAEEWLRRYPPRRTTHQRCYGNRASEPLDSEKTRSSQTQGIGTVKYLLQPRVSCVGAID
jgi:hypothetical protein